MFRVGESEEAKLNRLRKEGKALGKPENQGGGLGNTEEIAEVAVFLEEKPALEALKHCIKQEVEVADKLDLNKHCISGLGDLGIKDQTPQIDEKNQESQGFVDS